MLQKTIDWIMYSLLKLNPDSSTFHAINFFAYDSIKIILLIFVMISVMGFIRSFIPQKKVRAWLSNTKMGMGNLAASAFGSLTPFCSCSSIPIFLSFLEAGIPLGITFSFLITSPLVNEYLVVLMLALFGWKITLAYVISGILIGTIAGIILGKMGLEKHLVKDLTSNKINNGKKFENIRQRIRFGIDEALSIIKKLWIWILIGVGIGAMIHNYVPQEMVHAIISKGSLFTVPIAVILGVPMYGSCAAIVPIALALFQKGLPLGTALAFMMATAALSLPEAIILRRAMKLKLIAIFFSIVALAIILTGYLFNFLTPLLS